MNQLDKFVGALPEIRNKIVIPPDAKLLPLHREIIMAIYNYPKISEYKDRNWVANSVINQIGLCFFYVGMKPDSMDPTDLQLYYQTVVKDVYNKFKTLTLQEVELAFSMGVRGELGNGEYFGLNPLTFYKFLQLYKATIRSQAEMALRKLPFTFEKTVSEEEMRALHIQWLKSVHKSFDHYVETGEYEFLDVNGFLYTRMIKRELINFSLSQCRRLWKSCEKNILERNAFKNAKTVGERNEFKKVTEYVFNSIGDINTKNSVQFQFRREFMKLAVIEVWKKYKIEGIDFKEKFVLKA